MTRREELSRQAARLFAAKGYHGTSIGDLAEAMGVQKGSLYAHIEGKQDLLFETMRAGAEAFHGALDAVPEQLRPTEKIRLPLRGHLRLHLAPRGSGHGRAGRPLLRPARRRDAGLLDAFVEPI